MRRSRSSSSPYRALAHHPVNGQAGDAASLIRSFNVETNPTRPVRPSPLTASTLPDMPLDLLDRMRSFPLFMSAPEEFLVAIGKHLRPQVHSAHDHVLTEGEAAKAMYWLVRGVVAVTSRDGEAIYAELKAGSFFGEIGVLMNMPRTATIIARSKCLLLVLKKEDLQTELPGFPEMEQAIREEANERLSILYKKRQESGQSIKSIKSTATPREAAPGEVSTGDRGMIREGTVVNHKKRKSPSPGIMEDPAAGSALGSGFVNIRHTLKELPLFSTLPPDILHFLGMSAQPKTYPPFTDIIREGTPGNEIFFVVRGEAEVIHDDSEEPIKPRPRLTRASLLRPRLRQGQYFGEVASLGLSLRRTATVRAITTVECLMITGEALDELWRRCPPGIRDQVVQTAKTRIKTKETGADVEMTDASDIVTGPSSTAPQMTFTTPSKQVSPIKDEADQLTPRDPDPFLSVDMENMRSRRRGSIAPPVPATSESPSSTSQRVLRQRPSDSALMPAPSTSGFSPSVEGPMKKAKFLPTRRSPFQQCRLPDDILVSIFQHVEFGELFKLRIISTQWRSLLSTSPRLCTNVDLSQYNRTMTDHVLADILAPFLGKRPREMNVSNCFHVTDEGFSALWKTCGKDIKVWKMKSVWDVSANQILEMSDNAKGLEEVDWSNCRKVGDNLLARVVGWVVPEHAPQTTKQIVMSHSSGKGRGQKQQTQTVTLPPPGTVIGCPKLRRLNLSYCKHITDRSMAHMAAHASNRIERLSLTRCTSISDAGFQSWAPFRFQRLTHLYLADCTYLSDNAIVALVNAAKALTHLDLSFCCALSDTATEVVALGLPQLQELKMAFCGSAVSDQSLASIALHLNELERLSVRGCVRVTGVGIESILEGCGRLVWADISQCRNLEGWVSKGGVVNWGYDENNVSSVEAAMKKMTMKPPRGVRNRRPRRPVAFAVEKGPHGLR
ncbi:F-box and leucine-rich repeat protein 7 [Microdochium nivale]|nr:F-box and leucine-rich repeat protein 7 [Microdochium nivale]